MLRTTIPVFGAAFVLLLAGCGGEEFDAPSADGAPSMTSSSLPATSATTTSLATTAMPAPTGGPATQSPGRLHACGVRDVDVAIGGSEGTAGTMYHALVFTNTGRRTCTIQGFPGVSFVAGEDGHQVGAAATQVGERGPAVVLTRGAKATAPLGVVNTDNFDPAACQPVAVRGLRVYPPQEKKAEFVPWDTRACSGMLPGGQLRIRTVHAGGDLT